MPVSIPVADIQGFTPAIDPRKFQGIAVVSGKNFVFDADSVRSFPGAELFYPFPLGTPAHVQFIDVLDQTFVFTDSAILTWDKARGVFQFLFQFPRITGAPHKWTAGFLNQVFYFCHPATGIIAYDVATATADYLRAPGLPELPIGIAVNNGRLVVFDSAAFYWSAQSNGRDFTPELAGPGFQLINDRVPGTPLAMTGFAAGVMTWTDGGVMFSEFTGDVSVYRHRAIHTSYRPINSFCATTLDDETVLILDKRGLFASQGGSPIAFDAVMNEYLDRIFANMDSRRRERTRMCFCKGLFIDIAVVDSQDRFTSLVRHSGTGKWGLFSREHYAVGSLDGDFAYVNETGLYVTNRNASVDRLPDDSATHYLYRRKPKEQVVTTRDASYRVLSDHIRTAHLAETGFVGVSGYRTFDGTAPQQLEQASLDSYIRLGPFRFTQGQSPDEMAEVTNLSIGSLLTSDGLAEGEDLLLIPSGISDEDFVAINGAEDFGFEPVTAVDFDVKLIGTLDGFTAFSEQVPMLATFAPGLRHYSANIVGIWHLLEVKAGIAGQAYQIRWIDFSAFAAGRSI